MDKELQEGLLGENVTPNTSPHGNACLRGGAVQNPCTCRQVSMPWV